MPSSTNYDNSGVYAFKLKRDLVDSRDALLEKVIRNQKQLQQYSKEFFTASADRETTAYKALEKLNCGAWSSEIAPFDKATDVLLAQLKSIQNEVEALMISEELTLASKTQLKKLTAILTEYTYTLEVLNLKNTLAQSGINISRYM